MADHKQSDAGAVKGSRQERLKQALRENLKRRKAQARERKPGETEPTKLHEDAVDGPVGGDTPNEVAD